MTKLLDGLELQYALPDDHHLAEGVGRWVLANWILAYKDSEGAQGYFDDQRPVFLAEAARQTAAIAGVPPLARAALAAWSYKQLENEAEVEFVLDVVPDAIARRFGLETHGIKLPHSRRFGSGDRTVVVHNGQVEPSGKSPVLGCYGHMVDGQVHLTVFLHFLEGTSGSQPAVSNRHR